MTGQSIAGRVAAAPISWGICEVPGWGFQMSPDRVLGEMKQLGFTQTELGSAGWLPSEASPIREQLERHDMNLLGAFVPLVLHDPAQAEQALVDVQRSAALLQECNADYFIDAPVMTSDWGPRRPLSDEEWAHMVTMLESVNQICEEHSLHHVIHEHHGVVIETKADIERLLATSSVDFVLDTGHMAIGGLDPLDFAKSFADRVGLVHLKDAKYDVIDQLNNAEITLMEAVEQGIFQPLGQGDLPIADVINHLEQVGYTGTYVLEQDCVVRGGEPAPGEGAIQEVVKSLDYLAQI